MSALFMFTIGPVKAFIENSRKAMDLYAGSRMLSEVMREAVGWLDKKEYAQVLFPIIDEKDSKGPANIPNRLVAEFLDCPQRRMRDDAEGLAAHVKQYFIHRCLGLIESVGIGQKGIEMAERQLENFLEVYWVFEEYDSSSDYLEVYRKLFSSIQAVKGIRPFTQIMEPWGRKCMLFSDYNAIFAKKSERNGKMSYPYHVNPDYVYDITNNTSLQCLVKNNEALSSIALAKRVFGRNETDIYSIRRMVMESRAAKEMNEAGITAPRDMVANAVYDLENGQIRSDGEYTDTEIEEAGRLLKLIWERNIRLCSYYSIVKFDGDSMGEAFKQLNTVEKQRQLSERISRFAGEAPRIFKEYGGLPVFAGGEDFLGFLPLDGLFQCLRELRDKFGETVKMSFSAGISIAHLMQPLKEAMAQADEMESAAKRMTDKNAFAIGIIKRSGENVKMPACKLTAGPGRSEWKDVESLVLMLKKSQCSKAMFFKIMNLFQVFAKESVKPKADMMEILLKKCVDDSFLDGAQADREKLAGALMLFYKDTESVSEFIHMLDGIAFLSREVV